MTNDFLQKVVPESAKMYLDNEDEYFAVAERVQEEKRKESIEDMINKTLEDDEDQV